jgi:hypothetical protein
MRPPLSNPVRRVLLVRTAEYAGLAALAAVAGGSTPAAAKAAKSEFMYQDHRHEGKGCGECRFFSPESDHPQVGSCSIVEGAISREGWCMAFSAKLIV